MLLRTLIGLLAIATCSACAKSGAGIESACAVFQPISYSTADTAETVRQVEAHDVKYLRLCTGK